MLSIVSQILHMFNIQWWHVKLVNSVQTSHQPTDAQSKKTVWRLEIMFQENDQESGKEYSTTVQIIMKDDCKKVIAWCTVSCKMTCYVSDKKK